ncbi:MAG: thiamine-phosphate kinase, partial [Pseudomonadales bacterium]
RGLGQQALAYNIPLVGGDTTHGPLTISVHIVGQVPQGQALLRSGAGVGDSIYVSGTLGDAAAALQLIKVDDYDSVDAPYLLQRFYAPEIDFALGAALRGSATAAIDVSDGLLADLGHILKTSRVGAVVNVDAVPRSAELLRFTSEQQALDWALSGGDDYRLCFTMPAQHAGALRDQGFRLTCIGEIVEGEGLRCQLESGEQYQPERGGYQHF